MRSGGDWERPTPYKMFLDETQDIDIPDCMTSLASYSATLGHKVGHPRPSKSMALPLQFLKCCYWKHWNNWSKSYWSVNLWIHFIPWVELQHSRNWSVGLKNGNNLTKKELYEIVSGVSQFLPQQWVGHFLSSKIWNDPLHCHNTGSQGRPGDHHQLWVRTFF